jgi:transketolase
MHSLHPQARTTPAVRQEIARSTERTGVLAQRFSVSTETIRKWRKRGAQDCQDHSNWPHKLPWNSRCQFTRWLRQRLHGRVEPGTIMQILAGCFTISSLRMRKLLN